MDNFSVALAPTCAKPRGLVVEATSSSITLNWSDTTNNGATYSILCIQGSDTLSYTTTTDTTHTFTGLAPNTDYTATVRAVCAPGVLSDPAVACDPEQCLSFGAARADAENELQELYEKWEALQSEASC